MKRNKICVVLGVLFLTMTVGGIFFGCQKEKQDTNVSHYTCPMHPQVKMDAPGSCPICGMTLVPVKKEPLPADHDAMTHEPEGTQGIRIDPTSVQNVGVKLGLVTKRNLEQSVLVYGKTAHDPELWVAQHEYIEAVKLGDRPLIQAAERKLEFLGLSKEWIALLNKKKKADLGLFLPDQKRGAYFEAFLHPEDLTSVQVGQMVSILDEKGNLLQTGKIVSIGVTVDPKTRLIRALVLSDVAIELTANRFVQFRIQVSLGERLSLARDAVLFNGDRTLVYRVQEKGIYIPTTVTLGELSGEYYEVKAGVVEGETVVTNGHFLIDSEAHIRTGGKAANEHVH